MEHALEKARRLLENVTPLNRDCGLTCGHACCLPDEDGQGGMLLFPGEEQLYRPLPEGFQIEDTPLGPLLTCQGRCRREMRPLSCRLFPLWIFPSGEGFRVKMDRRGWAVCPLMDFGRAGLSRAFVEAASEAARALWQIPQHRAFLIKVSEYIDSLGSWD